MTCDDKPNKLNPMITPFTSLLYVRGKGPFKSWDRWVAPFHYLQEPKCK